jgi:prevent-host-death family protein
MTTIGAFEAEIHFASLLDREARGEQITVTRHGAPVARLVPVGLPDSERTRDAIAKLKTFRKNRRLGGLKIRDLIGEGRR